MPAFTFAPLNIETEATTVLYAALKAELGEDAEALTDSQCADAWLVRHMRDSYRRQVARTAGSAELVALNIVVDDNRASHAAAQQALDNAKASAIASVDTDIPG